LVKRLLTETSPLAKLFPIRHLDQRNLVLAAKRNDELLVCLLFTGLVEDTHVCLATIEGLGSLTETTGKSIVDESKLENTLESLKHAHLAFACGGIGADFDLASLRDGGGCGLFSVRLHCV
jgi:hypothetical protein